MSFHKLEPFYSKDRDGRMPEWEQYVVCTLAMMNRQVGIHAVEIGTLYGETTTNIARAMPHHTIITVDIPPTEKSKLKADPSGAGLIGKTPEFGDDVKHRIERVLMDSADLYFPPQMDIGFALIDGEHTYEYAWNDFRKIEPALVRGGVIMFHDVGLSRGVGQAVEEIIDQHRTWQWSAYGGTSLCWGKKL